MKKQEIFILIVCILLFCLLLSTRPMAEPVPVIAENVSTAPSAVVNLPAHSSLQNSLIINPKWQGQFERRESSFSYSILDIVAVTDTQLSFKVQAFSGAHTGGFSGVASITSNNAIFQTPDGTSLVFTLTAQGINIAQSTALGRSLTNGISLSGDYLCNSSIAPEQNNLDIFTPEQEQLFKRMVGSSYKKFANTAQLKTKVSDPDNPDSLVYTFNVRGFNTILESIIVLEGQSIWAAVIDGDKVLYFANTDSAIPPSIVSWYRKLANKPLYFALPYTDSPTSKPIEAPPARSYELSTLTDMFIAWERSAQPADLEQLTGVNYSRTEVVLPTHIQ